MVEQLTALATALAIGVKPDERMLLSDWSDAYRVLDSKDSAEPGPWRTSRTPYLQEIMDQLSPQSPTRFVAFEAGAQIGKTSAGLNWTGYTIDKAPGPMLVVQPSLDIAKLFSTQRLTTMIDAMPRLHAKVPNSRSRDSGNTIFKKEYPGGIVKIGGANSASSLRSMPVRYLYLDEVDAYPLDVDGEGDPVRLAIARTRTFARRKVLITSTPTLEGSSRVHDWFLRGDQRRYFVPCLGCGVMNWLQWKDIKWTKGEPETARWCCPDCGHPHEERHKTEMLAAGHWEPTAEPSEPHLVSYHLSSLYSPVGWFSWREAVQQWESDHKNQDKLKVFVNTVLGEPWKSKGDAPEWERLYERRDSYKQGVVPDEAVIITAGVDVQKNRIECEIVAWGEGMRSWSVDMVVLPGATDTVSGGAWLLLDQLFANTWPRVNGSPVGLSMMAVDSGYNTQVVYSWVRQKNSAQVMAVKGSDTQAMLIGQPTAQDIDYQGKRVARGVMLWKIGTSTAKSELYGWLKLPAVPNEAGELPDGFCSFPEYDAEYFKQLTAEQLVLSTTRQGYKKYTWEKTRERNEALDCRVYARAAAAALGLDRWDSARVAEARGAAPNAQAKPVRRVKRKSYLDKRDW